MRRRTPLLTASAVVVALGAVPLASLPTGQVAAGAPPVSHVSQFQPDIIWGGRTVSIDIASNNAQHALAASESGGLFRTRDNGSTWTHVDGLRPFRLSEVRFSPDNPGIVLATTNSDSALPYPGPIWRSNDGGATWSAPATGNPGCAARPRADGWGIDFEAGTGRVYVATDCGVSVSTDMGATWVHRDLPGGNDDRTGSVAARTGGTVDACGPRGTFRSTDAGGTFTDNADAGLPRGCNRQDTHALGVSPTEPDVLWATVGDATSSGLYEIYESDDAGANWVDLDGTQTIRNRPPFAIARPSASVVGATDVYFGNGIDQYRQTCAGPASGTRCVPGVWAAVATDHTDMMDLAFPSGSNCPTLMAGDGGVHRSTDCGASWTVVGAGAGGYNALQVYEVNAQIHPGHTDYYFGTQDNDLWASGDSGTSWPGRRRFEGFFLTVPRTATDHTDVRVTGVSCAACSNFTSEEHFDALAAWNNPDGANPAGNPFLIEKDVYMQYSQPSPPSMQLNITTNGGTSWAAVPGGTVPQQLSGRPEVSGPAAEPTIYQAYTRGDGSTGLLRITGTRTGGATVTTVDAGLGDLGGWCNGQGTFVCKNTFGVDPHDPDHLIAPDTTSGQMRVSRDGGTTWVDDPELTGLVTMNGTRNFGGGTQSGVPTQARAVYFDPTNSDRILVGTEAAGVIASLDDGQTWYTVPGSTQIPAINTFVVDEVRGDVVASTYGRGLWKVDFASADLSISTSHHPEPATAGEPLVHDVVVRNDGPDTAPSVRVVDRLDPRTRYVTSSVPCTADTPPAGVGQTVECQLGDLASGASRSFDVETAVAEDTVSDAGGNTSLTSTATASSPGAFDPDTSDNSASDTAIVHDEADAAVAKICDSTVRAGETARCTIYVDNHGPSYARDLVLTDRLTSTGRFTVLGATSAPSGSCTTAPASGPTAEATITCAFGDVEPATTSSVGRRTVTVTFSGTEQQTVRDVATVRSDTPDPDAGNDQAESSLSITSAADLRLVSHTDTPDPVVAGQPLTFQLELRNDGVSTAEDAELRHTAPAGVTITSVTPSAGTCTAGVPGSAFRPTVCTFGHLAPGTSRTVTVVTSVLPDTTGPLHADARVSSSTFDPDEGDNLAHTDTAVSVVPDLAVTLTGTPDPVVAGTALTYKAVVRNAGPSTARGTDLSVSLPREAAYQSATVSPGGGTCAVVEGANRADCQLTTLQPGQQVEVFVQTLVAASTAAGQVLTATALAGSDGSEANASDNGASTEETVSRRSDLGIVLTSDADAYKPSTVIHYTLTTTNRGPSDAGAVVVRQTLPPARTGYYVSDTGGCTLAGQELTCPRGVLAAGGVDTFVVKFFVQGSKGTMSSTATAASASPDPDTANNTSTRVVTRK